MSQETSSIGSFNRLAEIEYLSYDEQLKIRANLVQLAETVPLREKVFHVYGPIICGVPITLIYFLSWRAGFRGYGLIKYGKGRVMTIASTLLFPTVGFLAHSRINEYMIEPFRKESSWYWGSKQAIYNQIGLFPSILAPMMLTFIVAQKMNILPIPDGMHNTGIREVAVKIFYAKVKKYLKPIAIASVASTAFSFCIGVAAYNQTCRLLTKMGRRTLGQKENSIQM